MPVTIEAMRVCVDVAWTAFVTDAICSFNAEIRYIWKARPCLLTACFFGARYITFVNLTFMLVMFHGSWSEKACNRLYLVMPILTTLGLACAAAVCCMRVLALHHRSRFIFSLLAVLFTAMVGIQSFGISQYTAFRDDQQSCIAAGQGVWLAAYWLAPAILDLTLLLLAIFAVVRETRQHGSNRLLEIILRDQVVYFLFVFSGDVVSAVLMTVNSRTIESLNNPPCIATAAIGATRLILNLKAEGRRQAGLHARGDGTGSSGRNPRSPRQKPGVLSWWSSQGTPTVDSPSASRSGNNKSWLSMHATSWTTNPEATQPLKSHTDVELASFTGHDTTAPVATTAQGEHTIDSIEVHQIRPPLARCKTSSTFWSHQRGADEESAPGTNSLELSTCPQADRLIGLGDATTWGHHARKMTSSDHLNMTATRAGTARQTHTAMSSRGSSNDVRGGTATPGSVSKPGMRMGTPRGAFLGCNIQTETTTVVERSSRDFSPAPGTSGSAGDIAQRAHALRPDTAFTDPYQQQQQRLPSSPSYVVDEDNKEHISAGDHGESWYDRERSSASHTSEDTLRAQAAGQPRPA